MKDLNKPQRIAVLAVLAFLFWVFGSFLENVVFSDSFGWVAYAPLTGRTSSIQWTLVWHDAVLLAIWAAIASVWLIIAIRALRTAARDALDPDKR